MKTDLIPKTFDLLEDLAKNGVIEVYIGSPPPHLMHPTLPGIFALIPVKKAHSYPSDLLWDVVRNHGGMSCGNGMGFIPSGKYYWCQAQCKEVFFHGHYIWTGQETNEHRKWNSPEILAAILDIDKETIDS
jgi:hypothetical protein